MEVSHVVFKDGVKVRSESGLETYIYTLYTVRWTDKQGAKNYEEGIKFKPTLTLKEEDLTTKTDNLLTSCYLVEVKIYAEGQEEEKEKVEEVVEYS